MAKRTRFIPFSLWPAHWGLSGSMREKAKAEYYFDGEDLAYKLLEIKYPEVTNYLSMEYKTEKLILDYKYHKIVEYDFGLGMIENNPKLSDADRETQVTKYLFRNGKITHDECEDRLFEIAYPIKDTETYIKERLNLDVRLGRKTPEEADHELLDLQFADKKSIDYKIAQLELELTYGNITQNQFDKETATLLHEPWFNFLGADQAVKGENVQMAIQLDWNEYFVQFLEKQGWTGVTSDEIVDKWFESAMKQMLHLEDLDPMDTGDTPMPMAGGRYKRDDGLTEYK